MSKKRVTKSKTPYKKKASTKSKTIKRPSFNSDKFFEKGEDFAVKYEYKGSHPDITIYVRHKNFDIYDLEEALDGIEYYESNRDGWKYLYDSSTDTVYYLNEYDFDKIAELRKNGFVKLYGHSNDGFEDYEWNHP